MKILWLTNIPSPYRVKFFNELGKKCELTVLFEKRSSSERDESWKNFQLDNFKAIFLSGKSIGVAEAICFSVVKYINKEYDHIVVTNYSDPTGIIAVMYMKSKGIHYEIEGDGAFPTKNNKLKNAVKKFILSKAEICFSTAKMHDKYYMVNGVPREKIARYPFSSICKTEILDCPIDVETKQQLKNKLNIKEQYMVLAVGQFIFRKGYDNLIKAASCLSECYGIYIVGGETSEEYVDMVNNYNCQNVHFVGFKKADELSEYYEAADIFLHPTREDIWGLVVNEAMAKGLPVITTNKCIAGLEMVQNNKNGTIGEVDDIQYLVTSIMQCCDKKERYALRAIETAKKYTIDRMVSCHLKIWNDNRGADYVK